MSYLRKLSIIIFCNIFIITIIIIIIIIIAIFMWIVHSTCGVSSYLLDIRTL